MDSFQNGLSWWFLWVVLLVGNLGTSALICLETSVLWYVWLSPKVLVPVMVMINHKKVLISWSPDTSRLSPSTIFLYFMQWSSSLYPISPTSLNPWANEPLLLLSPPLKKDETTSAGQNLHFNIELWFSTKIFLHFHHSFLTIKELWLTVMILSYYLLLLLLRLHHIFHLILLSFHLTRGLNTSHRISCIKFIIPTTL